MSQQTLTQVGAFTTQTKNAINDNFTELYQTSVGGALPSAKIIVGNGSNLAAAVDMGGDAEIDNAGAVTITGINGEAVTLDGGELDTAVLGVAAGYKVARGITALDGSNPTTIATGLATITGFAVCLNRSTSLASGTAFVTYNNISAGSVDVYAWVVAGTASTGTENVAWVAVGT
jgi:hypothetical protein